MAEDVWRWEFLGFVSETEGPVVQLWFNGLSDEAKEEIIDLFQHLQIVTASQWRRPEFDPLDGEGGISEVRPQDIRTEEGSFTYRIYGYFGPEKHEYTLLHGTLKLERNDRDGKRIATERLARLRRGEAGIHKFDFEGWPATEAAEGA